MFMLEITKPLIEDLTERMKKKHVRVKGRGAQNRDHHSIVYKNNSCMNGVQRYGLCGRSFFNISRGY